MTDMPKYVLKNKRLSKTKTVFIFRRNYLNINDFKKAGNDWILYHGVNVSNPHGRVLLLDRIYWKNGWPMVKGASASTESKRPRL